MIGIGLGIGIGQNTRLSDIFRDMFNRTNNSSTMGSAETGQTWNPLVGTFGIQDGRAYCVSDTSANITTAEVGRSNYSLECVTQGQITDLNNQRFLNILFRANDASNYLMTRITGGNLHLYKSVSGTLTMLKEATITNENGVDYRFTVRCEGNDIRISVNGVQIQHTLVAGDSAFLGYTKVGLRLTKSGAPTMPASADSMVVRPL
jgi:hypothetical protein